MVGYERVLPIFIACSYLLRPETSVTRQWAQLP